MMKKSDNTLSICVYEEFKVNPEEKIEYNFVFETPSYENITIWVKPNYFENGTWARAPQDFYKWFIIDSASLI